MRKEEREGRVRKDQMESGREKRRKEKRDGKRGNGGWRKGYEERKERLYLNEAKGWGWRGMLAGKESISDEEE